MSLSRNFYSYFSFFLFIEELCKDKEESKYNYKRAKSIIDSKCIEVSINKSKK